MFSVQSVGLVTKRFQSKRGVYISAALLLPSSGFLLYSVIQYAHTAVCFVLFSLFYERETVTIAPSDSSLCFVLSLLYFALCMFGGIWVIGCILGLRWFLQVNGCLKVGNQSW